MNSLIPTSPNNCANSYVYFIPNFFIVMFIFCIYIFGSIFNTELLAVLFLDIN